MTEHAGAEPTRLHPGRSAFTKRGKDIVKREGKKLGPERTAVVNGTAVNSSDQALS